MFKHQFHPVFLKRAHPRAFFTRCKITSNFTSLCRASAALQDSLQGMAALNNLTSAQQQLYCEIQDVIGPASLWPRQVFQWFHYGIPAGQSLSCKRRPLFAAFFWVNGLNPEVLYDWCRLKSDCHPPQAVSHYRWLFATFNSGQLQYLYSWNICQGRYEYLNGQQVTRNAC